MSLIPGGRADKFGNRFERLWIVSLALDVIDGRLSTIKWEPLGFEGEGVECVVTQTDGVKIYHQCKIQNGNKASWTIAELAKNGVLQTAKKKLESDPRCKFVFISDSTVPELRDMAMHAKSSDGSSGDFARHCLISKSARDSFNKLRQCWALDSEEERDAALALGFLSRMEFDRGYRDSEETKLHRMAEVIVEDEGKSVVRFLGDYLEQNLGNTLASFQLVSALHENGYSLCDLRSNPSLPSAIKKLQARFREALVPHLINQQELNRSESEALLQPPPLGKQDLSL
jgi:hypothetical protein